MTAGFGLASRMGWVGAKPPLLRLFLDANLMECSFDPTASTKNRFHAGANKQVPRGEQLQCG